MTYSYAWDESSPSGASDINLGDDRIREMKTTIRQALDDEHTSLTDAPSGSLMHAWKVTSKSTGSPYTALSSDHIILVTTGSSADYAIYLPTAVGITGKPYKIKKVDSGTKAVVITTNGAETIDGEASVILTDQNDFADVVSDGTNWIIVAIKNTSLGQVPVGGIIPSGLSAAPSGYLLCDGTSYLRTDYANLFSAIGTTFGSVDGTHFNVPDMRGAFPLGKAVSGTGSTLGETGGSLDAHIHSVTPGVQYLAGGAFASASYGTWITSGATAIPPFVALNYIIKY